MFKRAVAPLILVALLILVAGCGNAPGSAGPAVSISAGRPSTTASEAPTTATEQSPAGSPAELPTLAIEATIEGFNGATAVVDAGDAIWVLEHSAATLTRIDPATNKVTARLVLGSGYANGLGLAGGRVWTFEQTAGQVVAVDPRSAKIVATVKLGQEGDWFWVGDDAAWLLTSGTVARIDGATAKVTSWPLDASCAADGVAADAGFVWIATASGSLCKIDENTGAVVARGSETGNGSGIAIVGGRPWIAGTDGGLSIVDPGSLAVAVTLPAPSGGTSGGSTYSIGVPGGENTVVTGNADGKTGWVRYTGATIGRVNGGATPSIALFAGLPAATFAGGVTEAFGSLWVANFDGGTVQRCALPKP